MRASWKPGKPGTCLRGDLHPFVDPFYTVRVLRLDSQFREREEDARGDLRRRISALPGVHCSKFSSSTGLKFSKLSVYLSSLLSLLIATLLGFLDDVFDIRWRHKIPIPIIASIPLLMVYYAERGNTHVVVPIPLRFLFGTLVNLGVTVDLSR
jgi:hypothetical protein